MIPVPAGVKVWLATGTTDMRRGMNGLSLQVQQALQRDPHAGDVYVFRGRRGDLLKILWHDGLGMSDYLTDMAASMSGLAGNLRGKSAEQLLHDGAELARSNPALFIAGSIAIGFGLSRFLKAGTSSTVGTSDPAAGHSTPPSDSYGAHRPYETSITPASASTSPGRRSMCHTSWPRRP